MLTRLKNRRFTNVARYFLDEWLPPVIRDSRLLFGTLGRAFHGRNFDPDFKRSAHAMTEAEFAGAYARLGAGPKGRYRLTDMTEAELEWMTANAVGPEVLEVGCGHGVLAERLARRGDLRVTASDMSAADVEVVRERLSNEGLAVEVAVANAEHLPFPDKSFDTVLCAHTLEHVRKFETAVAELVRVARKRLLVIVPCQRYYRYTVDYHLHFFPEPEQLVLRMGLPRTNCEKVTGDLCYRAELETETESKWSESEKS
jgi:SAM-dependent methyltransferase